ncbi:MAG: AmmeMemoRadiSam system protein A [Chromatiaceae bacterium]|nr:AmmeMemoRadiSam system protein A [Chromatiaceae bacterium]
MHSTEGAGLYSAEQRRALLALALASIRHGLTHGRPARPNLDDYADALREPRAAFVTLHRAGALRGCIGSLEAEQPLALEVADKAFAAAFRDPRFPALRAGELADLALDISVLAPPEPLPVASEAELLGILRPGIDGLILSEHGRRATFLPSVWEQLPAPADFLAHLKRKAGLAASHWSRDMRFERYGSEAFGASVAELDAD